MPAAPSNVPLRSGPHWNQRRLSSVSVGRAYNVAGEEMSVWQFFTAWRAAGGRSARVALPVPFPFRRSYDTTRARTELGWRSRPAGEALRETLALEPRPWRRITPASVRP